MGKKKKTIGRPPKPVDEQKNVMFQIRMTAEERAMLDEATTDRASTWAREVLLRAAKREAKKKRPSED